MTEEKRKFSIGKLLPLAIRVKDGVNAQEGPH